MQKLAFISLICMGSAFFVNADEFDHSMLMQKRLDAFNSKDINTLVNFYQEDVEVFYFPDKLVISGIEELHSTYSALFKQMKCLTAEVKERQIKGRFVFEMEATKACTISPDHTDLITSSPVAYELENGLIKTVVIYQ